MSLIDVASVRARLNKTTTVDDGEIQDMIDAAEAEYAELLGPVGTRTLRLSGTPLLILPLNSTVTSVAYTDGTVVDPADLDFDAESGILRLASGYPFTAGSRNVVVTVETALPANHREAIVADVAGYFAATQRGNSGGALPTPGYEAVYTAEPTAPVTLFPRIRALAASYPSIA